LPIVGHNKFFCHTEKQKYKLCFVRFIKCTFKYLHYAAQFFPYQEWNFNRKKKSESPGKSTVGERNDGSQKWKSQGSNHPPFSSSTSTKAPTVATQLSLALQQVLHKLCFVRFLIKCTFKYLHYVAQFFPYQECNFNWKEVNAYEEVEYQVYLEVEVQT